MYAPYIEGMEIANREIVVLQRYTAQRDRTLPSCARASPTDSESAYIDADVRIGMDTVVLPDVYMSGRTVRHRRRLRIIRSLPL